MLDPSRRPGYKDLVAARRLRLDDPAWLTLTENTLGLPAWMLPAVIRAVHNGGWRVASYPIQSLRGNAKRLAGRMGLTEAAPPASNRD